MHRMRVVIGLALSMVLAASVSLGAPRDASARCRPAVGFTLARVGTGAVRPGGTVLLELRPVYEASQAVGLPMTTVSVRRRGRPMPEHLTPRQIAANLYAFEVPTTATAGHYMISPAALEIDVDEAALVPTVVAVAPELATPPLGETRIGTGTTAATLALRATAPTTASGVLVRWPGGTWFTSIGGSMMIGPGRCVPDVPGYDRAIERGESVSARFVDFGGTLAPEVTFTAP